MRRAKLELIAGGPSATKRALVARMERFLPLMPADPWGASIDQAAIHIIDHCTSPFGAAPLARTLNVDETTLRREFKRRFRVTLREYHLRSRVAAALRLLADGERKITAIARSVGYKGEKNFFQAVRRFTGTTPGRLRALAVDDLRSMAARLTARGPGPSGRVTTAAGA